MANNLDAYNPVFYVQEALIALENALGMAGRVYRGLDDSQSGREKGELLTIKVPGAFVAADAPSAAQDISATSVQVDLAQHREVKFAMGDKELSYTNQQIIADHIRPAAYALVNDIDQKLCALVDDVPWYSDWSSPIVIDDITSGMRTGMFNNKVNMDDPSKLHFMVDGTVEGKLLSNAAFAQWQGAGDKGVATQMSGYLGSRYGFNIFANQNAPSRTSATVADLAGAINSGPGYAAGTTTIAFDGITNSAVLAKGDIIKVTGHTQQYVLTAAPTVDSGGAVASATIFGSPFVQKGGLEAAVVDNQVVTVVLAGTSGASKVNSIGFHEGAFALAMAKLPDFYDGNGVRVTSVADTKSRLALRARTWVDANNSKFYVALDALFAVKTLDGNKAWRVRR